MLHHSSKLKKNPELLFMLWLKKNDKFFSGDKFSGCEHLEWLFVVCYCDIHPFDSTESFFIISILCKNKWVPEFDGCMCLGIGDTFFQISEVSKNQKNINLSIETK